MIIFIKLLKFPYIMRQQIDLGKIAHIPQIVVSTEPEDERFSQEIEGVKPLELAVIDYRDVHIFGREIIEADTVKRIMGYTIGFIHGKCMGESRLQEYHSLDSRLVIAYILNAETQGVVRVCPSFPRARGLVDYRQIEGIDDLANGKLASDLLVLPKVEVKKYEDIQNILAQVVTPAELVYCPCGYNQSQDSKDRIKWRTPVFLLGVTSSEVKGLAGIPIFSDKMTPSTNSAVTNLWDYGRIDAWRRIEY